MQNSGNNSTLKILAPAGSVQSLISATKFEADVVYFGLDKFNARMKAENFNEQNLREWTDYCHIFGTKVFVTINTSLKNDEFAQAAQLVATCYNAHVDGLILTDIALVDFSKQNFPSMEVTLSTQQNICNKAGASIAERLQCDRVVLARETSLSDIKNIASSCKIEVEVFCHGALCVCMSGQCLFSSMIDSNSGNRGLCAQPCRQKYTCVNANGRILKKGYLLSAKDLCQINNLKKFAESGVSMLKIEGRNRRPQYVAQTVSVYKKTLNDNYKSTNEDLVNLKQAYNRGDYTEGFLFGNANIIYPQIQGHKGIYAGKVTKTNNGFFLNTQLEISKGDAFKVVRNNEEVGNCLASTDSVNGVVKLNVSNGVTSNDLAYRTTSVAQTMTLDQYVRKLPIYAKFIAKRGQPIALSLTYKDISVLQYDAIPLDPINQPLSQDDCIKQLSKTGNTYYTMSKIDVDIDAVYISIATINNMRRSAIEKLSIAIIDKYNSLQQRDFCDQLKVSKMISSYEGAIQKNIEKENNILLYLDSESVEKISENDIQIDNVVVFKPIEYSVDCIKNFCIKFPNRKLFLDIPNFASENDISILMEILAKTNIFGIVANNLFAIDMAKNANKKIIFGLGMNIYNDLSLNVLKALLPEQYYGFVYSQELTVAEVERFHDKSGYLFVQGQMCMMTFAHCPVQVNYDCTCKNCNYEGDLVYFDKTNRGFSLKRKKISKCYWELYNCTQLFCGQKYIGKGRFMIFPDSKCVTNVYYYFNSQNKGVMMQNTVLDDYTTGHLFKRVK